MTLVRLVAAAALSLSVDACSCNQGAGRSWVKNRACGSLGMEDGVWYTLDDGSLKCQMRPLDERNRCPDSAPVEEELTDEVNFGYVWCDCMDEHQRIIKAATQAECMRTEGLTDEQDMAYQAAGIDTRNYVCECCACQSQIRGVPKVGDKAKTCNAGAVDVDDLGSGCALTTYYAFAGAVALLTIAGCYVKLQKRAVEKGKEAKEKEEKKKKKGKKGKKAKASG